MGRLKKYRDKQADKSNTAINFEPLKISCIYGFSIFILSEVTNWIFSQKHLHTMFMEFLHTFELDVAIDKAIYAMQPHFDVLRFIEQIAFLKDWVWLISFAMFAALAGSLYTYVHEKGVNFKIALSLTFVVLSAKFLLVSLPYGVLPAFLYFIDFITKFSSNFIGLLITCIIFLFIGSEIMVFWIKNYGEDHMKNKYRKFCNH